MNKILDRLYLGNI